MISFYQTAPRYETKNAIDSLTLRLGLPAVGQDFDIEAVNANRVEEFCDFYQQERLNSEERFSLMKLILASYDDLLSKKGHTSLLADKFIGLLLRDYAFHFHTVQYWSCDEDFDAEAGFAITPLMRKVCLEATPSLLFSLMQKSDVSINLIRTAHQSLLIDCLMYAAEYGYTKPLSLLLERNIDLETREYYGRTALHLAIISQHETLVELLIQAGAHVNVQDFFGTAPILSAAIHGDVRIFELLLTHKADPTIADKNGYTALHGAVEQGHFEIVLRLLDEKPLLEQKTNHGETPYDIAKRHDYQKIMRAFADVTK